MNGDKASINLICRNLVAGPLDPNTEVVVGCPAVYIEYARSLLPAEIGVAGQVNRLDNLNSPYTNQLLYIFFDYRPFDNAILVQFLKTKTLFCH